MLTETIQKFLTLCENDPALLDFARKKTFHMLYSITDQHLDFYMFFKDGRLQTGIGQPPSPAQFSLKMKAATFEGVMRGQIDGTRAAMSGEMRFQGDPLKAMALQKIQKDLNRLYLQAIDQAQASA